MVVTAQLLALTTAAFALSGITAIAQASASRGASESPWAPIIGEGHGPVWNRNQGRHNQNAPAINSPTTVTGVQQVSSVSENTNTQSGLCKRGARVCKIHQKLNFFRGW
ncbi:hypothetical protein [Planotetraspora mira]|uniref:Secreted protein n=1 Tax=Planotetraspora mira TaxID=58121 RepID=A0A8J3TQE9_9ACTN|nr:hypothetical protein [Planotetraspora mira]GII28679.1 hypothetical protein Pmi06nite_21210 [Planotetraspora mira]